MTNCMDVCWVEPWRGTKFCVRAAGRCASPCPATLQSGSMFPTQHSEAGLERTGVQELLQAHPPVYLCPCCYLYPVSRDPTASCYPFCLFPSREHPVFFMFVQLAIISIFKSYPTVGDIALYMAFLPVWSHLYRCKFFVFVPSLEWERACPIIVTTKANQGCLVGGLIFLVMTQSLTCL